ncbi:ABC transporter ATP-binding protein [Pigmentiphaga soli]|uniref:ABC transporter ATP-binding protein n=1 Tax=Pigmentiphaga soli TaxID=1007095 RepID=A0ABP8H184_9BURK
MADFLDIEALTAGYGDAVVLNGLSLSLRRGRSLAVLGRNGAGKTTLIETVMGHTTVFQGAIRWQGADITRLPPAERARRGIGWVPQQREVFPSLTVHEHLRVAARPGPWTADAVYELFPRLRARRRNHGGQLSGGEQQMLAIGRALTTNPTLLLLDEPMEGLAPILVAELAAAIGRMGQGGLTTVVVEQHPALALAMTHDAIVLERGAIVHAGESAALAADGPLLERLLGVPAVTAPNRDGPPSTPRRISVP